MVTYYPGPWQDGPLTTEVHDIGAGTITRTAATNVAEPAASGWSVAGWKTWLAGAEASKETPGGLTDPPPVLADVSEEAFKAVYQSQVSSGFGGGPTGHISHPPMQFSTDGLGTWRQSERWDFEGGYWKLRYRRPSNNLQAGVAPPVEFWPEGAVGIGFDYPPPGNISQYWIELVSVTVVGTDDPDWPLWIKQPLVWDTSWFGDGITPESGLTMPPLVGAMKQQVSGSTDLSPDDFAALVRDNVENGEGDQHDVRWLSGSVIRTNIFPGPFGDASYTDSHGPLMCGQVRLTYRPPRWRYIYDRPIVETVPYRRIHPRHDSLAGGAGRNYPPSRAIQTSNRIGGAYL